MTDYSGPAFPLPAHGDPGRGSVWNPPEYGMTLRDWFAGQALMGALAYSPDFYISKEPTEVAERMYKMADAMLAERAK